MAPTTNPMQNILTALNELMQEPAVNKSIKERIGKIISYIKGDPELGKDKAMAEIEDILAANDIESDIRAQIWNVVSLIESG